jgi:rhamnosyltransferase
MTPDSPTAPPHHRRIVAVVAAFNPRSGLLDSVRRLAAQTDAVLVVDDGSTDPASRAVLTDVEGLGSRVLRQPENLGIAAALNRGMREAFGPLGADAVLTSDQDSLIGADYVAEAVLAWDAARAAGHRVGLVGPADYNGNPFPVLRREGPVLHAFDPLQSGALIPAYAYREAGGLAEDLFIDGVDSEYTLRLRSRGFAVLIAERCHMSHALGDRRAASLFGRRLPLEYNYHAPFRVYYMARNSLVLWRRYGRRDPKWLLRRQIEEAKAHVLRLAFSPDRGRLALALAAGVRDAAKGRLGKAPQALTARLSDAGAGSRDKPQRRLG